jgi:hypothetical protein
MERPMITFQCPWCETESGTDMDPDAPAFECPVCLTVVLYAADPVEALAQAA